VAGDDLTIEFVSPLRGAPPGRAPDEYAGTGVRVTGTSVTIRAARVHGFRVGIHAVGTDGLALDRCDVSDNFRQRLRSTPQAEDVGDWLWPHANDDREWITRYGAGICVERARDVTISGTRARAVQNGILLDRVTDSRLYDNDCSFLSGWGIALWRSSGNVISRNALDFCVRGYSHGVYNRGQDSAGLLLFEQCSDNLVAENSITHGGDGLFLFAGREALGETGEARAPEWYHHRGSNKNLVIGNDLSHCVAHGAELTFSFGNRLVDNLLEGNGICGVWGGYSQGLLITGNTLAGNGSMPSGSERGGINIEHGANSVIFANEFRDNACGVFLWWDEDEHLLKTPWARRNERGSTANIVSDNLFSRDTIAIQLRATTATRLGGNEMVDVGTTLDSDEASDVIEIPASPRRRLPVPYDAYGETRPVGGRPTMRGREHIVMTEWGPHDGVSPAVRLAGREAGIDVYELLGAARTVPDEAIVLSGDATLRRDGNLLHVASDDHDRATPYGLVVRPDQGPPLVREALLLSPAWAVRAFAWTTDPREDVEAWRAEAEGVEAVTRRDLMLPFAGGGPAGHGLGDELPADRFGIIATTSCTLPAGRWKLVTRSDDGIRVWLDGAVVIDDWTWHAPRGHEHVFVLAEETAVEVRVEHFELDGYAVLEVGLARE
jgi:parallel beta-helix repeat protein